ncbi:DUF4350 domain-containing protein [Pseudoduganella sp.]|uniref:DUF4350 domain-containing protein n=1 Tax=Pseudoduganella sp. TaxID=1880898 RepID=UPI0035AFC6B0
MKRQHTLLIAILLALLAGAGYSLWPVLFEKVWRGTLYYSDAQLKNPMLAATRLLEARGHKVRVEPMLNYQLLNQLPDGVLILSPWAQQPDARQAELLLQWVRRGNTLVMTPGWVQNSEQKEDAGDALSQELADPLGKHFGVAMASRSRIDDTCRLDPLEAQRRAAAAAKAEAEGRTEDAEDGDEEAEEPEAPARLACLHAPGAPNRIELRRLSDVLQRLPSEGPQPLWGDTYGLAVLVFGEGRGKVAMVASEPGDSYFDNDGLRHFDHGELLLLLAGQSGPKAPVLLVRHNETVGWAAYLWQHWRPLLYGLAALLLLWAWDASRRFGPLLPALASERRALIEHIDASGRWLWRLPQGRALLLGAVRQRTEKLLLRRLPELHALDGNERARRLARLARLPEALVTDALLGAPAARAAEFTRQISTLQQLRAPYER